MHTDDAVDVPIGRFAEAFFRSAIVIGVMVVGYTFAQPYFAKKSEISDEKIVETFGWDETKFRSFLKEVKREQLTSVLAKWIVDPRLPADLRQRVLKNQILAARKISSSPMARIRNFGVSKEIQLRTDLTLLMMRLKIYDPQLNESLLELASVYKTIQFDQSNDSQTINELAQMGEIVAETVRIVETVDLATEPDRFDAVLEKTNRLSENFLRDSELGKSLTELAELAEMRLSDLGKPVDFPKEFFDLLGVIHSQSRATRIQNMKEIDCRISFAASLNYLAETSVSAQESFLSDFEYRFQQMLEITDLGQDEYVMLVTKLGELAESGWPLPATEMLNQIIGLTRNRYKDSPLQTQIDKLRSRFSSVGQVFELEGIQTLDNQQAGFRQSDALATLVIYISFVDRRRSETTLKQLGAIYNDVFRNARIDFSVVYLHEDDIRNGIEVMRKVAKPMKSVDFWQLNMNSVAGKLLNKSLSIDETPYLKILDSERRVAAINPRLETVVNILNKLKSQR